MQTEISQLKNRLGIVGSHHNVSHHLPPSFSMQNRWQSATFLLIKFTKTCEVTVFDSRQSPQSRAATATE